MPYIQPVLGISGLHHVSLLYRVVYLDDPEDADRADRRDSDSLRMDALGRPVSTNCVE